MLNNFKIVGLCNMRWSVCLFSVGLLLNSAILFAADKDTKQAISKKQAVELALADFDGKTLKISERGNYYIVRILQSNGRIVDLKVNKQTGEVKKD